MSTSGISTPRILTTAVVKNSAISTPRILATGIINKSSITTPRILVTVVPSTAESYYFDATVNASADIAQHHNTALIVQQDVNINADTGINLQADTKHNYDTDITIKKDVNQCYDTALEIEPKDLKSYCFDTYANIQQALEKNYDTNINLKAGIEHYYDIYTGIKSDFINYHDTVVDVVVPQKVTRHYDILIGTLADSRLYFDTCISIPRGTTIPMDTIISNPFRPVVQKEKSGMVSISLNLQELTLADTFTLETTDDISILDYVSGKILDFPYLYRVGETMQQDRIITAKGMYDVDEILYRSINYGFGQQTHKLSEHASRIAGALGKKLVYRCDDFVHSGTWIGDGQTYENIISSLFGWSSVIPHKAINVFMRTNDNSLNVIQRGHESRTIDITDTAHTRPVINRTLERSMINYSSNSIDSGNDPGWGLYVEPLPFWGTLKFGDATCSYESGYLRSEENNGEITTYDYTGDGFGISKYLSRKSTQHTDGSKTVTTYDYSNSKSGVLVLGQEVEITTDKDGKESVRKTVHAPLGGGFYGTSVYVDGEFAGSSIGTGSPAAAASRYLHNQESITLGGANYGDKDNPLGKGNRLKESVEVPTSDTDKLEAYLSELKWLNRKVKETVTMDIYNYGHVIDFSERVRFRKHEYYLVSNTVSQTTRELKQSIQLVRWY
ncbi:hypothetical protein D081_2212 [Anaerovibrio sp. JC8]|uniref:hypothetical protein n=1 Tax=Anaerovibrio sp. JC8 TaxID=1240085 RepID=UPI000A0B8D40|nr:hypothetical protein [Anaerovibrio sp. JC8]ORT99033.1 hypothetical protein D081_2212 [Anaerovibrio sp. JC8]